MNNTDVTPMCDVVGCTDNILAWVDGVAHCARHLEDVWDFWQAVGIDPHAVDYLTMLEYRQSPRKSVYAEQVERLTKAQNERR